MVYLRSSLVDHILERYLTSLSPTGNLRATCAEPDLRLRLRDETLLALLVYAGVRIQEVCDLQLRNLDLASGTLVVRRGKGGKARRLPVHEKAA